MIALNYYKNIFMGYAPSAQEFLSWEEFATRIATHAADDDALQTSKHEGFLFNMYEFKTVDFVPHDSYPEMGSRCSENAVGTAALMLDIDEGNHFDQINQVVEELGVNYIQYSTFSNSEEKEKFRLMIELDRSYSPQEIQRRKSGIVALLESVGFGKVDGASFSVSQAFYLPAYSVQNIHLFKFACKSDGGQLPLEKLVEMEPERVFSPPASTFVPDNVLTDGVRKLLGCLRDIHYTDVIAVANVCKAYNIPCNEFIFIVKTAAASGSSILSKSDRVFEDAYNSAYGVASIQTVQKLLNGRQT